MRTVIKYFIASILLINMELNCSCFYIDSKIGSDDNSGKAPWKAWRSIEHLNTMWQSFNPGDTILFRRNQEWRPLDLLNAVINITGKGLHGTEINPIVISAYGPGNKPIISCENSRTSTAFFASNISYVIIKNIHFIGEIKFHNYLNNLDSVIKNVKLIYCISSGSAVKNEVRSGIDFYAQSVEIGAEKWNQAVMNNIEIGYCTVKNSIQQLNLGIQLYGQGSNWIHHNKVYNSGRSGINFAEGNKNTIEFNLISGTYGAGIKHSVHSGSADSAIIRCNVVLQTNGIGLQLVNLTNSKIYNNTVVTQNNYSFFFGWNPQNPVPYCGKGKYGFNNNLIANNIFVGRSGWLSTPHNVKLIYKDGTIIESYKTKLIWSDNKFHNNIFFNPYSENIIYVREYKEGTKVYYDEIHGGVYRAELVWKEFYIKKNDLNEEWLAKKNVNGDKFCDPKFVDSFWNSSEDYGDFSLKEDSPAKSKGINLDNNYYDLLGNIIPPNHTPNIGAIQN